MPVRMGGHFCEVREGTVVQGSIRGEGRGRENNVRKRGGKRMYKQYREKNDSSILVTTTQEKENKNHTSKIEEFVMEKGQIYERSKHINRKEFGGRESGNEKK
jgi:hypothetical protein